jgi:hypothetical protein
MHARAKIALRIQQGGSMQGKSREVEETSPAVWFFILLVIGIFVLYCLSMMRPYC